MKLFIRPLFGLDLHGRPASLPSFHPLAHRPGAWATTVTFTLNLRNQYLVMFIKSLVFFLVLFTFASATFIPRTSELVLCFMSQYPGSPLTSLVQAPIPAPRYGEHAPEYGGLDAYNRVSGKRDFRDISRDPVLQALQGIAGRELPGAPHTEHTRGSAIAGGGLFEWPFWR